MMKVSLVRRRRIKNALYIITTIRGRGEGVSKRKSAKIAIDRLNSRRYTPRKLDHLFEGMGGLIAEQ